MKEAICISESSYSHALTRGKIYQILERDVLRNQLCLIGDNGRKRWFPAHCFDFEKSTIPVLRSFKIDNPIIDNDNGAIEVTLIFTNNEKRWCLFLTPKAFTNGGDTIRDTGVTFHYNLRHLIVVDALNIDAIGSILDYIDRQGRLIECSLPLDEGATMTPEQYLDALLSLPGLYGAKASSDGKWVAWSWGRTAPTFEVYAAPTDGSQAPIRLTDTPENTFLVSWTPDNQSLIITQDKDGNERQQLFRVDLNQPLMMHPLTEENPNYFIHHGELHPNGKWLVYAANFDLETCEEIELSVVIRHDLDTGERVVLASPEKNNYNYPQLSPTGEYILYNRSDIDPSGDQMWLVGIDGTNDHEILNAGDKVKTWASWFPDGKHILVQVETDTHKKIGVRTVDDATITWLLDDPTRNIEYAFTPDGTDEIVIIEINNAVQKASLLHPETGVERPFPTLPGSLAPIAPVGNDEWIGVYFSSTQPTDIVRFKLDVQSPDELTSISRVWERTQLTSADLTPAEDFRWQSTDALEIQGWLYRTNSNSRGTVLYVHGGPTGHSSDAINNQIQYFVKQGFNVLDPNYRGSTGFNLAYRESIKQDGWGGMEQVDIRTGIEALIQQGISEKGKVGITGTSYGGYSSWYAITHFDAHTLKASAPICGMTDLVVDYETTRPDLRPYSEEMMGGRPDEVPERYYERSPINFVQDIQGRLLIIQGMQDPNVTPQNVTVVREKLDEAGVEYGVLAFDDEGHGISKPRNQKRLYTELAQFFESAFAE